MAAAAACLLVWLCATEIPARKLKKENLPECSTKEPAQSLGQLETGEEKLLVAEDESRKLYLNTDTLNFWVEDKKTGHIFEALKEKGATEDKSPLRITFVGEDSTFYYYDAYEYCIKYQTYTLEQIENGFRMNLNLKESDSTRINEYMPQKITIERYETRFLQGIADKAADGTLTEKEAEKYTSTLGLVYAKDEAKGCYYNRYSQTPPISTIKQLIEITKILGYTTEELMEDNAVFGISVNIEEPADFLIPVEVVLSEGDLVVRIATDRIENRNSYYTMTKIDLLSCFGALAAEEAEDGYLLIPDGSGALLRLNSYNANYGSYSRALYDNTYYNDYYYVASFPETLHMPVFGMMYTGGDAGSGGIFAIIEEGDAAAYISATLASSAEGNGSAYNRIYSGYDVTKYAQVSILGPYDSSNGLFLEHTGMMKTGYQVRYKFFTEEVTYYDMASVYRDYLIEKYDLTPSYGEQAELYIEATGALSVTERILGIPYNKAVSMTSYRQLQEIMEDLKAYPTVVSYLGVFDGGLTHKLMNSAKLIGKNGTQEELSALQKTAQENGQKLFLQVDFTNIYSDGNGFSAKKHGSYNFNDDPIEIYGYSLSSGRFLQETKSRFILSPSYLSSVVEQFLKEASAYDSLYVEDLASGYYADYSKKNLVTPEQAQKVRNENLSKLAEGKTLALNDPEIDKIIYGDYAVNISRESCGWGCIAADIPFRQLVMNGLIRYTTTDINESGVSEEYFLLQALELGSCLKYTITAESLDVLKHTDYSRFISREYSILQEGIKNLYERYEAAFAQINCMEIVNHRMLTDGVFETTYANGAKVITNYNKYTVTVDEKEISGLGYHIFR